MYDLVLDTDINDSERTILLKAKQALEQEQYERLIVEKLKKEFYLYQLKHSLSEKTTAFLLELSRVSAKYYPNAPYFIQTDTN